MKKITLSLITILMICMVSFAAESPAKIQFNAKDINNKNVTESIFKDADLTMINIWGTFCGPCINEMPDLAILNKDSDFKSFQVVGIVIDSVNRKGLPVTKTIEAAKRIAKQTGADYLHIVPDSKLLNGILSNVIAVPTTIFVDKNGKQIGPVYTGSRSLEDWKKIVNQTLSSIK